MLNGVRVRTWEREPSVYEVRGDHAVLVGGRDLGPVEVGPGDAAAAGMEERAYTPDEGKLFLRAVWIRFKGSRMMADRF